MSLLSKIKTVLGLDEPRANRETRVTVERERPGRDDADEPPRPPRSATAGRDEPADAAEPSPGRDAGTAMVDDAPGEGSGDPVDSISGIGPAYAERLDAAGVATVGDLAAADATRLAAETDISEKRLQDWIDLAAEAE